MRVKPHPVSVVFAVLGLFFSLGDLIGDARLATLEYAWRNLARRLLQRWTAAVMVSARWLTILGWYSIAISVSGAAVALMWYFDVLIFTRWSFARYFLTKLGECVAFIVAAFAAYRARGFLRATIGADLPTEVWLAQRALLPVGKAAYTFDREEFYTTTSWFALFVILPIVAGVLPFIIFGALILRVMLAIVIMTVWVLLFAPSLVLHKLSTLTGATSYFKLGKYIVVAGSVVWLLWQFL